VCHMTAKAPKTGAAQASRQHCVLYGNFHEPGCIHAVSESAQTLDLCNVGGLHMYLQARSYAEARGRRSDFDAVSEGPCIYSHIQHRSTTDPCFSLFVAVYHNCVSKCVGCWGGDSADSSVVAQLQPRCASVHTLINSLPPCQCQKQAVQQAQNNSG
jgi:hypothetical protein